MLDARGAFCQTVFMCGIAGVIDLRDEGRLPDPATFDRMVDSLARRGPDGRGVWRTRSAALGHRRLAILDPTPAGAQPMRFGDVVITFNGEIYNFKELRRALEEKGHRFDSHCDTEVILHAWREWGPACVPKLNGIFAFCIVDKTRVFLARDPLGIKPLFFSIMDGVLRFGSEMKAILADPAMPARPNLDVIEAFLSLGYVPVPHAPFEHIEQLPPAHTLEHTLGAPSTPAPKVYWKPQARERAIDLPEALDELRAQLHRAVTMQMVSDVPIGAFLSGGLDSAIISREMRALGEVRTFCFGFEQSSYDERAAAQRTAELIGSKHTVGVVPLDIRDQVLDVASTNDDLLADSSLLAVDLLCREARKHVTVALSGDGADELFAGYPTYIAGHLTAPWRKVPRRARTLLRRGVERLPPSTERYNPRDFALRFLKAAERGPGRDFASFRTYLEDSLKDQVLRAPRHTGIDAFGAYARAFDESDGTKLKRMMLADLQFYLPSDMLVKVDRASMRHGLEVRVPFLDVELVDWALTLPSRHLLSLRGEKKKLLRRYVAGRISPELTKRKKTGFNVPIAAALRGSLHDLVQDAIHSEPFRSQGPLDTDAVAKLARDHRDGRADHGFSLYAILVLALWWRTFC